MVQTKNGIPYMWMCPFLIKELSFGLRVPLFASELRPGPPGRLVVGPQGVHPVRLA